MKFLTEEQLNKLTTKRLLAYKNSLLKVHETPNWDENTLSKESKVWQENYQLVKEILAMRKHIEK